MGELPLRMREAVDAFWMLWTEEGELPYMARIRDFTDEEVNDGRFAKASEEADAKNDALIARCIVAVLPFLGGPHPNPEGLELDDDEMEALELWADPPFPTQDDDVLASAKNKLRAELSRRSRRSACLETTDTPCPEPKAEGS